MTLYANISQGLGLSGLRILFLCISWDFLDENRPHARSVPRQDDTNIGINVLIEVRSHDPLVPVVHDSALAVVGTVFSLTRDAPIESALTVCIIRVSKKVEPFQIYTYFIYKINLKKVNMCTS